MKRILLFLALFSTVSAFAYEDDFRVDTLSWCEDNRVVFSPTEQETKVLVDCGAENKQCVMGQRMTRDQVTFFAYCK